jgi:hypothetical protein
MHERPGDRLYKRDLFQNIVLYCSEERECEVRDYAYSYGLGVDISRDGIGLTFERPLEKGQILKLFFDVESVEGTSPVLAEVKWASDIGGYCRAGLCFLD